MGPIRPLACSLYPVECYGCTDIVWLLRELEKTSLFETFSIVGLLYASYQACLKSLRYCFVQAFRHDSALFLIVEFIKALLENIGTHVDPLILIQRIPDEIEIPKLRNSLVKILHDYNLQVGTVLHVACMPDVILSFLTSSMQCILCCTCIY